VTGVQTCALPIWLELDWYWEYWIYSTKFIDYAVDSVWEEEGNTSVQLANVGLMPMPVDVVVTYKDDTQELHYIPLRIMRGEKSDDFYDSEITMIKQEDWPWVFPTYTFNIERPLSSIKSIEIDPSLRMADLNRENNVYEPTAN